MCLMVTPKADHESINSGQLQVGALSVIHAHVMTEVQQNL